MTENKTQTTKDNLAFIIGGIFILGLVFATYSYFNKTPNTETKESTTLEKIKDMISSNDQRDSEEETEQVLGTGGPVMEPMSNWVATDYREGDIQKGAYTVQTGDTLWEIAEAVYGDGTEWVKILNANAASVGYLPNGSQALIVPGQTLVLP